MIQNLRIKIRASVHIQQSKTRISSFSFFFSIDRHISLTRVLAPPQLDPKANGAPVLGVRQDSNLGGEDRRHQSMRHHRRRIGIPSQHLQTTVTGDPFFALPPPRLNVV